MRRDVAVKVDARVVAFLVEQGAMPPWAEKARWADEAEKRLARRLQALFQKGAEKVIAEVKRRGMPAGSAERESMAADLVADLERKAPDAMVEEALGVAGSARRSVQQELAKAGMRIRFGDFNSMVLEKFQDYVFQGSKATMERLKGDAGEMFQRIVREGLGIDEAADKLAEVFQGLRENRLTAIARTEINGYQNEAANTTMRDYGVEYKQWLTAVDDDVRSAHIMLHGVVMRMDEPYPNGLMYPGDRSGPIEEWINCRCRQRPYIPGAGEVITSTPYVP
ncbi:MAG: minor capsid protein [Firmicutes bacterium]|nr:minor capsid protein [Bacillota bacterium]